MQWEVYDDAPAPEKPKPQVKEKGSGKGGGKGKWNDTRKDTRGRWRRGQSAGRRAVALL